MCQYCEENEFGHDPRCPRVLAQQAGRGVRARRSIVRGAASRLLRGVLRDTARGIAGTKIGNSFWQYEGEDFEKYRRLRRK